MSVTFHLERHQTAVLTLVKANSASYYQIEFSTQKLATDFYFTMNKVMKLNLKQLNFMRDGLNLILPASNNRDTRLRRDGISLMLPYSSILTISPESSEKKETVPQGGGDQTATLAEIGQLIQKSFKQLRYSQS